MKFFTDFRMRNCSQDRAACRESIQIYTELLVRRKILKNAKNFHFKKLKECERRGWSLSWITEKIAKNCQSLFVDNDKYGV